MLFQDKCKRILAELEDAGIELPGEQDADLEVWNLWCNRQGFRNKRDRVMMGRFQSCIARAEKEVGWWSMDAFEREYVALELDMLKNKKFRQKLLAKGADLDPGEGKSQTTSTLKLHFEDKTLRSVADNAVCISVGLLDNYDNKRICETIVTMTIFLKDWRTEMVKRSRSSSGSRDFLVDMTCGGAWKHATSGLRRLSDTSFLGKMRFIVRPGTILEEAVVRREDDFAEFAWKLGCGGFSGVLKRLLMFFGPPHNMAMLLGPEAAARKCTSDFQLDHSIFERLTKLPGRSKKLELAYQRHVLHLVGVQQYLEGFKELGFVFPVPEDLIALAKARCSGTFTTTIDEEMVGLARNSSEAKASHRYRRPEVCMSKVVNSGTLQKRWGFDWVEASTAVEHRSVRLDTNAFKAKSEQWSLPFSEVQSTCSTPSWYSPSHQNFTVPLADLHMWRDLAAQNALESQDTVFLGKIFKWQHFFVFEYVEPKSKRKTMVYPIHHYTDSSVHAVEVKRHKVPMTAHEYYELDFGQEPFFITMAEVNDFCKGAEVRVRSWAWQLSTLPEDSLCAMGPAIRLFKLGGMKKVKDIVCENAFWLMPKSDIDQWAEHYEIEIPKGSDLVETLVATICGHFKCDKNQALQYTCKRIGNVLESTKYCESLLEVDEAIYCLDIHDHREMTSSQQKAYLDLCDKDQFLEQFRKAKAASAKKPAAKPSLSVLPLVLEQSKVKLYIPAGSRCWRGNVRAEWWGELKPLKCVFTSLKDFGNDEHAAAVNMLRKLWTNFNMLNGLPLEECPIKGIFEPK